MVENLNLDSQHLTIHDHFTAWLPSQIISQAVLSVHTESRSLSYTCSMHANQLLLVLGITCVCMHSTHAHPMDSQASGDTLSGDIYGD